MSTRAVPARSRLAGIDVDDYALAPDVLARLMSPALVVYMDKVRDNVARMLRYMDGDATRWRPHLKTTKIPQVYALLVEAGLRNFKCATLREARCMLEVLRTAGVQGADLLIAYPLQGPSLPGAARLAAEFAETRLSVLSEDAQHAAAVPAALGVFVDVNPGMNRTGIPLAEAETIAAVARAAGPRWRGVHAYDGHIHDADAAGRRHSAHGVYTRLLELLDALRGAGLECPELITSGTPSFRYALDFPGFAGGRVAGAGCLHRVSPGTVVFHDFQYDELLEDLELQPAALVLARVISHPDAERVTCDAGSKSIAAECGNPVAFVLGHAELVGQGPSEEHLPLRHVDGANQPRPPLGTTLLLVPRHVCPTVNLAEEALLVYADGRSEVVPVAARAHPLLAAE